MGGCQAYFFSGAPIPEGSLAQEKSSLTDVTLKAFPNHRNEKEWCARFGSTYTKIGMIQRRLSWALHKDEMQIRGPFHIFEGVKKREPSCAVGGNVN